MKAAVLEAVHKIAVRDVADLSPGPDRLLLKTRFTGICGSDLHAYEGRHPFRKPPVVLGHEIAGTVAAVGEGVAGFRPGDRVTVMPLMTCGKCSQCRKGKPNLCMHKTLPGVGGWQGSFAEYFLAQPATTFKLGDNTSFQKGALAEPLAVGVHSARRAGVGPGSNVLILGGGTIGILTAVAARLSAARSVALTDLFAFNLDLAADLSGATVYRAEDPDLVHRIAADHPEKFDVIFLCSDAACVVEQALVLAAAGARIVVTGLFARPVPVDLTRITLNELELVGTVVYDHADFQIAVDWLNAGDVRFEKIVSHVFPLDQATAAMALVAERREDFLKVLLEVPQEP